MPRQKYTTDDLQRMQSWSLEKKILVSKFHITEWHKRYNGKVFVSFSGGKDSTVLLDLARQCFPDITVVFSDTGLDFPEVRGFAVSRGSVTVVQPKMSFAEVVKTHGWCYPNKNAAHAIEHARKGEKWAVTRMQGLDNDGTPSELKKTKYLPWAYLIDSPFKISKTCCNIMKDEPLNTFATAAGRLPIIGTLVCESPSKEKAWLWTGCNAYDTKQPKSIPIAFWTEQDILMYLKSTGIPYAGVYGDIYENKYGKLCTSGEHKTDCVYCPINCHSHIVNRFQRLKTNRPEMYDYVINELGLGGLLDYAGVDYGKPKTDS